MKKKYLSIKRFYYKVSVYILGFSFLVLSGCKWKKQLDDDSINDSLTQDSSMLSVSDTNSLKKDTPDLKPVIKTIKINPVKIIDPPVMAEYGPIAVDYRNKEGKTEEKESKKDTTQKPHKPDPMLPVTAYGTYPDGYKTLTIDKNQNKPTE